MKQELMSRDTHEFLILDQAKSHRRETEGLKMKLAGAERRGGLNFYSFLIQSDLSIEEKEKIRAQWDLYQNGLKDMTPCLKVGDATLYENNGKPVLHDGNGNLTLYARVTDCLKAIGFRTPTNPATYEQKGEKL